MNVWTTREGREIPLPLLSDDHLLNILNLLIRKALVRRIATERTYLLARVDRMGDAAQDAFMHELDDVVARTTDYYLSKAWPDLKVEAERRGLDVPKMPDEKAVITAVLRLVM